MARRKHPDQMTAEDEIRSVLTWAQRMGLVNIAAALDRTLAKLPQPAGAERARGRKTGRECGS